MEDKLQKLTEKIYLEGVEQGKKEADSIVASARNEAGDIVKAARKEAENILETAKKEAADLKRNLMSDIAISSRQAIAAVKQQIAGLVTANAISTSVQPAFNDREFMKKLLLSLLEGWKSQGIAHQNMSIVLPESAQKELDEFFSLKIKNLITEGLEIKFDESVKGGFMVGPKDGRYRISFREEDFESFFRKYLRPKTIEMLFGGSK